MAKFHINKHGVPAPCKAKPGNCPLGGDETHFGSREEAQEAIDKINEEKHGLLSGMREKTKENMMVELAEQQVARTRGTVQDKLESMAQSLERLAETLRTRKKIVAEGTSSVAEQIEYASNDVENVVRNLNYNTLVRMATEYTKAEANLEKKKLEAKIEFWYNKFWHNKRTQKKLQKMSKAKGHFKGENVKNM